MPESIALKVSPAAIPFIDLQAQRRRLGSRIDRAIARVLEHGQFIMGPEIAELERQLAAFTGVAHVLACGNGTDALLMGLMAKGIGPGDAVFMPAFTFTAPAEVAAILGATPVFVDVEEDSFNLDPASLKAAVAACRGSGLRPKAVIAVDLFGQPADYGAIVAIAEENGLVLLEDAAQSFGARLGGRAAGGFGAMAATSFYPAKPLGCYGDGGAVLTDDPELAAVLASIRIHGQGHDQYDNVRVGFNGRMDTIQAAILIEKLAVFPAEIIARQGVAARYAAGLSNLVKVPRLAAGVTSVWAQYAILLDDRARVAAALRAQGIPTAVYYPRPLHRQRAYENCPVAPGGAPVSERLSERVLALPMHAYLDEATQDRIIAAVRAAVSGEG
jgi:dTDP-4-amino-4,6-dideoxygalactose transaminase